MLCASLARPRDATRSLTPTPLAALSARRARPGARWHSLGTRGASRTPTCTAALSRHYGSVRSSSRGLLLMPAHSAQQHQAHAPSMSGTKPLIEADIDRLL